VKAKLNPQQVQDCVRLARAGLTLRQISDELGTVSYETVRRYLKAAGLTAHGSRRTTTWK